MVSVSGWMSVLGFAKSMRGGKVSNGPPGNLIPFSNPFILTPASLRGYLVYLKGSSRKDDSRKYVFDSLRKEMALSESIIGREDEVRHISVARTVWPEWFCLDRVDTVLGAEITGGIIDISIEGEKIEFAVSGGSGEFDDRINRPKEDLRDKTRTAAVYLQELLHNYCSFNPSELTEEPGYFSFNL